MAAAPGKRLRVSVSAPSISNRMIQDASPNPSAVAAHDPGRAPFIPGFLSLAMVLCSNCKQPLVGAIYQCSNHHLTCQQCWKMERRRCFCSGSVEASRCEVAEKLLAGVYISCTNSRLGCTDFFQVRKKKEHESRCAFWPMKCVSCNFTGSSSMFAAHFTDAHRWELLNISDYNLEIGLKLSSKTDRVIPLQIARDKSLFLIHYEAMTRSLYTTAVICEVPVRINLTIVKGDQELAMKSVPRAMRGSKLGGPSLFLSVPQYWVLLSGNLHLLVCVEHLQHS